MVEIHGVFANVSIAYKGGGWDEWQGGVGWDGVGGVGGGKKPIRTHLKQL